MTAIARHLRRRGDRLGPRPATGPQPVVRKRIKSLAVVPQVVQASQHGSTSNLLCRADRAACGGDAQFASNRLGLRARIGLTVSADRLRRLSRLPHGLPMSFHLRRMLSTLRGNLRS